MGRVAITADIHLGYGDRLQDSIGALRVLREYCKAAGIDTIIVLGDLFNDRSSLSIDVIDAACEFFTETATYNQHWIAFPGNHDMFLKHSWRVHSLRFLYNYLTIIDTIKILQLDQTRFWVIPYINYERAYMNILRRLEEHVGPDDCLFTHIGVRGATLNVCFMAKDWGIVNFDDTKFKQVFTGHFHSYQKVGEKVCYPGSLIPFKFDEGDVSHGFLDYDLETGDYKLVNIWKAWKRFLPEIQPPPQFHTLIDETIQEKPPEAFQDNNIRILLSKEYNADERNQLRARIMAQGARNVFWLRPKESIRRVEIEKTKLERTDLFARWTKADVKGITGLDRGLLQRLHDEIVNEGDQAYNRAAATEF